MRAGITPAYAGNTRKDGQEQRGNQDHPRIRGEHLSCRLFYSLVEGSPPHTRGTPHFSQFCTSLHGITPAYAGNTHSNDDVFSKVEDHPRIRGEHLRPRTLKSLQRGSPPHTRGTLMLSTRLMLMPRITPAYAGNTRFSRQQSDGIWDHPRIRGEHSRSREKFTSSSGSPPHTRGTQIKNMYKNEWGGITPAYAGNTKLPSRNVLGGRDHPRIRGEHDDKTLSDGYNPGSPPHTRGTLYKSGLTASSVRITPAYAGNTCKAHQEVSRSGDHPRIRGEHSPCL